MEVPSYLDKEAIRRKVPLAAVASELGIRLDEEGHALCPFHDDTRPSFDIWEDETGKERWGCFPCGAAGDVFDLVRRIEGVSFPEAMDRVEEIANNLPPGALVRVARAPKPSLDLDACTAFVAQAEQNALENAGWLCVRSGLVPATTPANYRLSADAFLRSEFHWGVDSSGNLVMPHFDAEGILTGCKMRRSDGQKWAFPGTRLTNLYGGWRQREHDAVLLTEGESDAVFAALQSPPVDVLALPAGAGKHLDPWAEIKAKTIYLAFDADKAGQLATARWIEALGGRDVRVCRLPRGHDLKSARPNVADLLEHSISPGPLPGSISTSAGFFERMTAQGPKPICSWLAVPRARLISGGNDDVGPALEVEVSNSGNTWTDVITMDDLHSSAKLRRWANMRSLDCLASETDTQHLTSYLIAQANTLPEVFQTTRIGAHKAPTAYRFAGPSVVTPDSSIGRLPWRYVGPKEIGSHVLLSDDGPAPWSWVTTFLNLHPAEITHPLLAWMIASSRRNECEQFPLLFLGGTSGSGKTTTAEIAAKLLGSSVGDTLANVTQFALLRKLATSTSIPVFIDEWTLQSRADAREAFKSVITTIYDGGVTPRGRADLSVVEYHLSSPVLVAGEDSFNLDREADRIVALRLSKSGQNHDELLKLEAQPINRFAHWYTKWLVEADELPPIPLKGLTRPEYNLEILRMGWATLREYMGYCSEYEEVPDLPELDLTHLTENIEVRENEYRAYLEEGRSMRDTDGAPLVWDDAEGRGTWVRWRQLASKRNRSLVDVELPGGSRSMKQYFNDRYNLVDDKHVTPPNGFTRVMATLIENYSLSDSN